MTRLILASASIARATLLRSAGVSFEVLPAGIDEDAIKEGLQAEAARPRGIAAALAERKALQVSSARPDALVIGADQTLDFDGELLSKSAAMDAVRLQLLSLRGRSHTLATAAVMARDGVVVWRLVTDATLWMRDFSDSFLDDYLAREGDGLLDLVGGYRLEGLGAQLFRRIDGDYFSILGLPLIPVLNALRDRGDLRQ